MILIPPGQRKNNRFYLLRAQVSDGRRVEISTKTADKAEAEAVAERFMCQWQERHGHFARNAAVAFTEALPDILASTEQHECGIYFLIATDTLLYVGQSIRIPARVQCHRQERRIAFDRWCSINAEPDDFDLLEAAYVHRYRPEFNRGIARFRRQDQKWPGSSAQGQRDKPGAKRGGAL